MKDSIERCDKLIVYLRARLEAGGLTYDEAVILDNLLTVLVEVQSKVGELRS